MHWSGEITLGSLVSVLTFVVAALAFAARFGRLQQDVSNISDLQIRAEERQGQMDAKLLLHMEHDERIFGDVNRTLNQLVGKVTGEIH